MTIVEESITIYIIKLEKGYRVICSGFRDGEPMHWESMDLGEKALTYHQAKIIAKDIRRTYRNMLKGHLKTKVIENGEVIDFPAKDLIKSE